MVCKSTYARPGPLGEALLPGFDPGLVDPGFDGLVVPGFVFPGFVVPGFDPGFDVPGLVEPGLLEPGVVGDAFGDVPGVVPFGVVVGGCVVLLGVLGFVGLDPGELGDAVAPVGGAVWLAVGGADGVACPGDAWPPDGALPAVPAPPPGAACATTHTAQQRTTDNNVRFLADFMKSSSVEFSALARNAGARAGLRDA